MSACLLRRRAKVPFSRAIFTAILGAIFSAFSIARKSCTCANSRRFYCNLVNSRHRDIADILNMFKSPCDIGAIFFAKKIAPIIAVNFARVNGP